MSAVAPQLPAPDFDAIEAGTTATGAVKARVRIPWRFLGNRALFYLFTLWAAITINFFLPRLMKGDAVTAYLARNRNVTPEAAEALRALLGLDTDTSLCSSTSTTGACSFAATSGSRCCTACGR